MNENGYSSLKKDDYWDLKRNRVPETAILERTGAGNFYKNYQNERLARIEDTRYLVFDNVFEGIGKVLEKLSANYRLMLVTLRNSSERLYAQLEKMEIDKFFYRIFNSGETSFPGWKVKCQLIKSCGSMENERCSHFIGDTETDILAGKALGLRTVAVSFGIRNKALLERATPDFIFSTIEGLSDFLNKEIV
jgi:phosphoglycolate phosphatase-like HAD superfamily hydrolase